MLSVVCLLTWLHFQKSKKKTVSQHFNNTQLWNFNCFLSSIACFLLKRSGDTCLCRRAEWCLRAAVAALHQVSYATVTLDKVRSLERVLACVRRVWLQTDGYVNTKRSWRTNIEQHRRGQAAWLRNVQAPQKSSPVWRRWLVNGYLRHAAAETPAVQTRVSSVISCSQQQKISISAITLIFTCARNASMETAERMARKPPGTSAQNIMFRCGFAWQRVVFFCFPFFFSTGYVSTHIGLHCGIG